MTAYRAVSLFSGCGGFCEGVRLGGFEVTAAVEWDRFAVQTYRHNFPEVLLFEGDIHDFLNERSQVWTREAHRFGEVDETQHRSGFWRATVPGLQPDRYSPARRPEK